MGWDVILSPHDVWLDVIFFVVVSVGCALLGWGLVYVASRIEHERRQRFTEMFGEPQQRPVTQRRPWIRAPGE
jgi:hypothetical protein